MTEASNELWCTRSPILLRHNSSVLKLIKTDKHHHFKIIYLFSSYHTIPDKTRDFPSPSDLWSKYDEFQNSHDHYYMSWNLVEISRSMSNFNLVILYSNTISWKEEKNNIGNKIHQPEYRRRWWSGRSVYCRLLIRRETNWSVSWLVSGWQCSTATSSLKTIIQIFLIEINRMSWK